MMKSLVLRPWLVMTLIFVLGIVTGVALALTFAPHGPPPPGDKQMERHWLDHLTRRLHLTENQRAKIGPILEGASQQIRGVHREEVDRVGHIFDDVDARISTLLTPDQQSEFQKLKQERQDDFARHRRSWGERPPPPIAMPPGEHTGPPGGEAPPPPEGGG
jgi:Spy/CpxP family protein refolding chaperone